DHEHEAAVDNHHEKNEVNNFCKKNSTASNVKGSSNLCIKQSGEESLSDLHMDISSINAESRLMLKSERTYSLKNNEVQESNIQEAIAIEQEVYIDKAIHLPELVKVQANSSDENIETLNIIKSFAD
ncbi:31605_t:CDS:2, partial [Gigaspora margarita]